MVRFFLLYFKCNNKKERSNMIHVIAAASAAHNATQQATNAAIMAANAANQASKLSKDVEDEGMEYIIGFGISVLIVIALALISYFWDDTLKTALHDFIEWTCSFNGTFDIKAFFLELSNE